MKTVSEFFRYFLVGPDNPVLPLFTGKGNRSGSLYLFLVPFFDVPQLNLTLKYGQAGDCAENDIEIECDKAP